ncbi:MAG TPA: hypothetical protein VGJ63_07825 [Micromonosporaceae bacterium]|jgi:Flp pilus assembly pilin Flp
MLMISLYCKAKALWATRDRGASSVEYALLVVGIAAAVAALVWGLGVIISGQFDTTCNSVSNGASAAC